MTITRVLVIFAACCALALGQGSVDTRRTCPDGMEELVYHGFVGETYDSILGITIDVQEERITEYPTAVSLMGWICPDNDTIRVNIENIPETVTMLDYALELVLMGSWDGHNGAVNETIQFLDGAIAPTIQFDTSFSVFADREFCWPGSFPCVGSESTTADIPIPNYYGGNAFIAGAPRAIGSVVYGRQVANNETVPEYRIRVAATGAEACDNEVMALNWISVCGVVDRPEEEDGDNDEDSVDDVEAGNLSPAVLALVGSLSAIFIVAMAWMALSSSRRGSEPSVGVVKAPRQMQDRTGGTGRDGNARNNGSGSRERNRSNSKNNKKKKSAPRKKSSNTGARGGADPSGLRSLGFYKDPAQMSLGNDDAYDSETVALPGDRISGVTLFSGTSLAPPEFDG